MLKICGYKKCKLLKMDTLSRNEQFEKIKTYCKQFTDMNFPVLSIDTKKKEMLGNFCRPGTCYSQHMRRVNDHDFTSSSDGQIVLHAHTIMILCDGGGSNASAYYIVKLGLCKLANKLVTNILMVHYPPYCSKYNPIEHKLFSHITRS